MYIGTLNLQGGGNSKTKKLTLAKDMISYNMEFIATTETKIGGGRNVENIKSICGKQFKHYTSGGKNKTTKYGVGLIAPADLNLEFEAVNERLCKATIKKESNEPNTVIIVAYAPTLEVSTKYPKRREQFYDELNALTNKVSQRDILYIMGDFNAKTGSACNQYPENMGKYGKGEVNENGIHLLEYCSQQNMILTNTKFKHKMAHRSTWQAPEKLNAMRRDGTPRRNPYRNMIDYIIVRNDHFKFVKDARSYSGLATSTDHRLVRARIKIDKPKYPNQRKQESMIQFDPQKLKDKNTNKRYQEKVSEKIESINDDDTPQEKWDKVVKACHEAAKETAPKNKVKHSENVVIINLVNQQKELNIQINSNINNEKKKELRSMRNRIKSDLRKAIADEENKELMKNVEEIENCKNDETKMYKAIQTIQCMKPRKDLLIETDNGVTINGKTQVKIITDFFEKYFNVENTVILDATPQQMNSPFTTEEVENAIKKLKDNKAAGSDNLTAEQLKFEPSLIIADILNTAAETGEHPREIKSGLLNPLQKPGKKKGPLSNLRPIILLSILRKILAICLMDRTVGRILQHIPSSQSAYQKNRSTTEQIFTFKLLAEKAITSEDYNCYILLMDMSKAFDMVERNTLLDDLKRILNPDEIHIVKLLIDQVELSIRVGKTIGKSFKTNIGIPQGDCLSPILFILYLAKAMQFEPGLVEHNYSKPEHIQNANKTEHDYAINEEQIYNMQQESLIIPAQYADDCGYAIVSKSEHIMKYQATVLPEILKKRNLSCNKSKTESYMISRSNNCDQKYKKCKYLGSLLDTTEDFKRRKLLTIDCMKTFTPVWKNKYVSLETKHRIFKTYVTPIMLYNSHLWTTNITLNLQINAFQRRMLRMMMDIKWPRTTSNEELRRKIKYEEWTKHIERARLRWIGHLFRLNPNTPAQIALHEAERSVKMPRGRRKNNWLKVAKEQVATLNMSWDEAKEIAQDRTRWRRLVNS